jgi:RimJ/RimL family protein N-acetyltransferase
VTDDLPLLQPLPDQVETPRLVAAAHTRRGYAAEAAAAPTALAFTIPHIEHVQIRCDPRNSSSAAIPRKLGFSHIRTIEADTLTPSGETRATMVWQISRRGAISRSHQSRHL